MSETSRLHQHDLFEGGASSDPLPVDVPVRFRPDRALDVDLEQKNRDAGHTRARRYLPAERAIEMAATAKTEAARSRLLSWVLHPDERVPLALMENALKENGRRPFRTRKDGRWIGWVLVTRGLESARENGELWNPLLDWASLHQWMWKKDPWTPSDEETDEERQELAELIDLFPRQGYQGMHAYLASDVIPWISAQEDPRRLKALLRFRSTPLWTEIARHAPRFDAELVDGLLEVPMMVSYLARNRNLTDDDRELIVDRALDRAERQDALPGPDDAEGQDGRPIFRGQVYHDNPGRYLRGLHPILINLSRRRSIDTSVNDRLLDLSRPPGWSEKDGFEHVTDDYSDPRWRVSRAAAYLLTATDWADPRRRRSTASPRGWVQDVETLRRLYPYLADNSRAVKELIEHPAATLDLWREVASDTSSFKIREWLVRHEEARTDPVIRNVLGSSSSITVIVELCRDEQDPETFRRYFRRAARGNALKAARLLDDLEDDARFDLLQPEDLMPLLQSEYQEVRTKGMLALGRIRDDAGGREAGSERATVRGR